ncbi:MAG: PAS domain S-box protein [Adhaeribacter sp.]
MEKGIKILLLEQDPDDIELLEVHLKQGGWQFHTHLVQTRGEFESALASLRPDIILATYSLPSFSAPEAFRLCQQIAPEIPFIVVSESIGEEKAVELIRMGVTDYIPRNNIAQVVPSIRRALHEAVSRRQKRITKIKLKRSEEQLRKIMDLSLDVICTLDQESRFITLGAASKSVWGYAPEELIGTRSLDLVHPEDREKTRQAMADLLQGTDLTDFENRHIRADGRAVPLIWSAHWEAGEGLCYCIARDATPIKQAAEKVLRSEKRFRSLLQHSNDGLTLLDAGGQVIERSPTALKILGLREEETWGRFRTDLVHPEDLGLVLRTCTRVRKKPLASCTIEYRMRAKDTGYKWIETTLHNLLEEPAVGAIVLNFRDITRKKLDEIALRENEVRLRQAQAIGHFGFWEMNLPDKQQTWTPELYQIYQSSPEETPASFENFKSLIHPDDLPGVLKRFEEAETSLENGFVSFRLQTERGGLRHVVSEWQFEKDEQGRPLRVIGILQDVTARRLDQIALLQSEARLKEAQAIGHIGSWELNVTEGTVFWSEELFRILGANPAVVQPSIEAFTTYIHPEDLAFFQSTMQQILHEPKNEDYFSIRIVRPDGETRYINTSSQVELDSQGRLARYFGTLQDVTEVKLAEMALEQSEQKYRNLFNFSPTPMWVYDAQTLAFLDVNQAAIRHYGYSKEEFASMTLRDIRPKSEIPKMEQVAFSLKGATDTFHGTFQHLTKAGELIEVDIQSSSLLIEGRKARLIIANDISERVRYLQAIQTQNARLKEIAWTQSHVVRAPLARMMGFIDLLRQVPPEQSQESNILGFIQASARELDAIIRDIVKKTEQIKDHPNQEAQSEK